MKQIILLRNIKFSTILGLFGAYSVTHIPFANIFSALYTSSGSEAEMVELQAQIRGLVSSEDSMKKIDKVSAELVKKAATSLKPHKGDVSQGFSSDALLHGPDVLCSLTCLHWSSGVGCCMEQLQSQFYLVHSFPW